MVIRGAGESHDNHGLPRLLVNNTSETVQLKDSDEKNYERENE
jgi:hypothetical protein